MRDLNKDFGAAVSEARRKLGLTQVGLAEDLGKTEKQLPNWILSRYLRAGWESALTQSSTTRRKAMFLSASSSFSPG